MLTEEKVKEALSTVIDPEINFSIVELGFIYNIDISGNDVKVDMTLTSKGCPMHNILGQNTVDALQMIEGVSKVEVRMVWDPPWNPKMMSEEVKKKIGFTDDMIEE